MMLEHNQRVFDHMSRGSREIDIDQHIRLIIEKEGMYLYKAGQDSSACWTTSAYDAWYDASGLFAYRVAKAVQGKVRKFNPITGRLR